MKIGKCEMPDEGNSITVLADDDNKVYVELSAETLAQSAFEHNIDFMGFKRTLDKFTSKSKSSSLQILAWREEATNRYFALLDEAGKLQHKPAEFMGGSDYGEDEDDPSVSNIKN